METDNRARMTKVLNSSQFISDHIWKTDLDWLIPPTDRIIILQFLAGSSINATGSTTQAPFHHPAAQIRAYLAAEDNWWPCSPEFINYALALLVFAVRYPAVFWNTNKGFSFLFSLQLLANSIQVSTAITVSFSGVTMTLRLAKLK